MTHLCYTNDTTLIAGNITKMKIILYRIDNAERNALFRLNAKKKTVININAANNTAGDDKMVNSNLEFVQTFKYYIQIR